MNGHTAECVRGWLFEAGALFIERGNPRENGHMGSFIGKSRGELLNRELFLHAGRSEGAGRAPA